MEMKLRMMGYMTCLGTYSLLMKMGLMLLRGLLNNQRLEMMIERRMD